MKVEICLTRVGRYLSVGEIHAVEKDFDFPARFVFDGWEYVYSNCEVSFEDKSVVINYRAEKEIDVFYNNPFPFEKTSVRIEEIK